MNHWISHSIRSMQLLLKMRDTRQLLNDEPLVTTVGNIEGQDEAFAGGMCPEIIDEQDLRVTHSFIWWSVGD